MKTRICASDPKIYSSVQKVYFKSQILKCPSIDEYRSILVHQYCPVNVYLYGLEQAIFIHKLSNTQTEIWSSIVQYTQSSILESKCTLSQV